MDLVSSIKLIKLPKPNISLEVLGIKEMLLMIYKTSDILKEIPVALGLGLNGVNIYRYCLG